MPKFPLNYRLARVLRFLSALRYPEVAALIAKRGFDQGEADRGWALLDAATGRHLSMRHVARLPEMTQAEVIERLVEWQRLAFDIADATLRNDYPELHEELFRGIGKVRTIEVVMTVMLFVSRLDEIEARGGSEVEAALALLAKRGLDRIRRDAGQSLIDDVKAPPPVLPGEAAGAFEAAEEQRQRNEEALWHWYLSWAQLARTVVRSKRLRIRMGISQMGRTGADPADDDEPAVVSE